jgi:hypothetical protein
MRNRFVTTVGTVDLLLDEQSGIVSIYRFGPDGRPVAAALEGMADSNLARVLIFEAEVPPAEAEEIAASVFEEWFGEGDAPKESGTRSWVLPAALILLGVLVFCAWLVAGSVL